MSAESSSNSTIAAEPSKTFWRPVIVGILALAGLSGGMWMMTYASGSAYLEIEADDAARAVMITETVTIRRIDQPGGRVLRAGSQSVAAGKYQIEVQSDTTLLTFSTGDQFEVAAGQTLRIQVTGQPIDP